MIHIKAIFVDVRNFLLSKKDNLATKFYLKPQHLRSYTVLEDLCYIYYVPGILYRPDCGHLGAGN